MRVGPPSEQGVANVSCWSQGSSDTGDLEEEVRFFIPTWSGIDGKEERKLVLGDNATIWTVESIPEQEVEIGQDRVKEHMEWKVVYRQKALRSSLISISRHLLDF